MKASEKDWKKQAGDAEGQAPEEQQPERTKPSGAHSSQGHKTDAKGTANTSREGATLRSTTTDSSRAPKNRNDEGPTGGNIR